MAEIHFLNGSVNCTAYLQHITIISSDTPVKVIYTIIGLLGLFGNFFVAGVLVFSQRYAFKKRSITSIFIINQCCVNGVASMCVLMVTYLQHGSFIPGDFGKDLWCRVIGTGLPIWGLFLSSTYNMLALIYERYMALVHPDNYRRIFNHTRLVAYLLFIWLCGTAYNAAYIIPTSKWMCGECAVFTFWPSRMMQTSVGLITVVLQYYLPVSLLVYAFDQITLVFRAAYLKDRITNANSCKNATNNNQENNNVKSSTCKNTTNNTQENDNAESSTCKNTTNNTQENDNAESSTCKNASNNNQEKDNAKNPTSININNNNNDKIDNIQLTENNEQEGNNEQSEQNNEQNGNIVQNGSTEQIGNMEQRADFERLESIDQADEMENMEQKPKSVYFEDQVGQVEQGGNMDQNPPFDRLEITHQPEESENTEQAPQLERLESIDQDDYDVTAFNRQSTTDLADQEMDITSKFSSDFKGTSSVSLASADCNRVTTAEIQTISDAKKNIIKTLALVSGSFVFCWSWNQIYFTIFNFGYQLSFHSKFYHFTVMMVYLNCCLNPVIFAVQYENFHKGLRILFCHGERDPRSFESLSILNTKITVSQAELLKTKNLNKISAFFGKPHEPETTV